MPRKHANGKANAPKATSSEAREISEHRNKKAEKKCAKMKTQTRGHVQPGDEGQSGGPDAVASGLSADLDHDAKGDKKPVEKNSQHRERLMPEVQAAISSPVIAARRRGRPPKKTAKLELPEIQTNAEKNKQVLPMKSFGLKGSESTTAPTVIDGDPLRNRSSDPPCETLQDVHMIVDEKLEQSKKSQATRNQQMKRKMENDYQETSSKKACTAPQEVHKGRFVAHVTTTTHQNRSEFKKTLNELGLIPSVECEDLLHSRHLTHLQESHHPDIWCVDFLCTGELAHKLTELLNQTDRIQSLDFMNRAAYSNKPTKKSVHIEKSMEEPAMALISFLMILKRSLGSEFGVDGTTLVAEFGRRVSLVDIFREYPEAAAEAYNSVNRYTKRLLDRIIDPNAQKMSKKTMKTAEELQQALAKLNAPEARECTSLLKKHLTSDLIEELKTRKTMSGKTFMDCVYSGLVKMDDSIGVFAVTQDSYAKFDVFFNKILQDIHRFGTQDRQPPINLGVERCFPALDRSRNHILSTRIRCIRSVKGFDFIPSLSKNELLAIEGKLKKATERCFQDELAGTYHSLANDLPTDVQNVFNEHYFDGDRNMNLMLAKATNHWPAGRGIFCNSQKTFRVFMNVEDHVRLESEEEGADLGNVLRRLNKGLMALENEVTYTRNGRLGWMTFSPANLGCTTRASMRARFPLLSARNDFERMCAKMDLGVKRIEQSAGTSEAGPIIELFNKRSLGLSQHEAVDVVYSGVQELIWLEYEEEIQASSRTH